MANYKKLETLIKAFTNLSETTLNEIIHNENVDVSTLSNREKFSALVFSELAKAMETRDHTLVLDCNYEKSGFVHKTNAQLAKGQEPEYLVDYYRLITKSDSPKSLIQVYALVNPDTGKCEFNLCTSCAKLTREQFLALQDELKFHLLKAKNGRVKTSYRKEVGYDELVDVMKAVVGVLKNTEKLLAEAKKAPKTEKPKKVEKPEVEEAEDDGEWEDEE